VDIVVAHKQERLSRSQTDTGILYNELTKGGVKLWTVHEGTFDDTPIGQFLRQVYAFAAELDREQRREATSRGVREKVKAGKILGAGPKSAYGYSWVYAKKPNGERTKVAYEVNEAEVVIVRRIFADVLAGRTRKAIARNLNDDGIPSPYAGLREYNYSGRWGHQTIVQLLRSPYYAGDGYGFIHAGREEGRRVQPSSARFNERGFKLPEGVIPAIIERDTWERVQDLLDNRLPGGSYPAHPDHALLRGIARCGICNRAMKLKTRGTGQKYLGCGMASAERKPCTKPSPTIKLEWLEEPVWTLARSVILDPYKLRDRFESNGQLEDEQTALAEVEARMRTTTEQRQRLLRNPELLEPEEIEEMKPRLEELKVQRETLMQQAG
jgi:hypothetical protein